ALETLVAVAGARGLALAAAAAGLAHARADAAADPQPVLAGAGIVGDLIELHDVVLTSCRPRRARGAQPSRSCRASPACPAIRTRGRSCSSPGRPASRADRSRGGSGCRSAGP